MTIESDPSPTTNTALPVPFYRTAVVPVGALVSGLIVGGLLGAILCAGAAFMAWKLMTYAKKWLVTGPTVALPPRQRLIFIGVAAVFAIIELAAWGGDDSAMSCSGGEAEDLVGQIYRKDNSQLLGERSKAVFAATSLRFDAVRTVGRNLETGALTCAAKIHANLPPDDEKRMVGVYFRQDYPIDYTVTRTDDGRLYVEARRGQ